MQSKILTGSLLNLQTQRKIAKIGMGVSLGLTTLSAFNTKNRLMRNIHIASGVGLVVFSLYHYGLYNDGFFQQQINKIAKNQRSKKA